jgi:hypothetical protein
MERVSVASGRTIAVGPIAGVRACQMDAGCILNPGEHRIERATMQMPREYEFVERLHNAKQTFLLPKKNFKSGTFGS